jgi:hypothetical protein
MIIEGFICPECQQDMTSLEMLQAHFELMHIKKPKLESVNSASSNSISSSGVEAAQQNSNNSASILASNANVKQWLSSNQTDGCFVSHTTYFKQIRDQTIGRYVIQTNKLLITLDKLISIDAIQLADETKRDRMLLIVIKFINHSFNNNNYNDNDF